MEYFVISAKFVPLKYYTLSSQLRRLTSFSVGLFGSANSVTRSYPVMRKSCISLFLSYLESSKWWLYPRGYIYVYNAKDCNKSIWKVTGPFPFASILNFKMAILMMCMMPKIAIKSHRKLLVDFPLAAILDFKMLPLWTYFGLYLIFWAT